MKQRCPSGMCLLLTLVLGVAACGDSSAPTPVDETAAPQARDSASAAAPLTAPVTTQDATPMTEEALGGLPGSRKWTGDFDGMVERRRIRVLAPYSRTFYSVDKGVPHGIAHDIAVLLEKTLNEELGTTPANKVYVAVIPTSRDALYDSLVQGLGDVVVAGITVTPERQQLVDFTVPTRSNVRQIVVTGPAAPPLAALDDLAGREVAARKDSLQDETLRALNQTRFKGKAPVRIRTVPASLEDEDLLEMVSAGLLEAVVVDESIADLWRQVLPGLTPHPEVVVRDEGAMAWAVRKSSPQLLAKLNPIVEKNREGTLFGNMLLRRYLKDAKTVRNATSEAELRKYRDLVDLFRRHAGTYDVDYLLMMAQGYQESQLNQAAKSHVGAIGVMQVMPATGKELAVGDIRQVEPNIEAGVKYMRFMIDQYFEDEPMDAMNKGLFAFASYNAGPARIRQMRQEAARRGLDPNVWFNNVERVVADKIGREPVTYVSNIYKYYVAYSLVAQEMAEKEQAKAAVD